jgi:hypothetical protein
VWFLIEKRNAAMIEAVAVREVASATYKGEELLLVGSMLKLL